ncbi:SDR family NAD(P)-dependent oxidoreductase [Streptomyces sp. NPDC088847]|uniref:SDR family NAD(P)-dependent oxidoreductase n=1 Tax=Streptomyces sp. NPDC088847 TaxID=3365909 RepID=UPI0038145415
MAHLFDVNVLGAQCVDRAALPYLRECRAGTLLYVGSTASVIVPPFLGPYVASKSAFHALAQVTSYAVNHFGIETVIVMHGPFTHGTERFPNCGCQAHGVRRPVPRRCPLSGAQAPAHRSAGSR